MKMKINFRQFCFVLFWLAILPIKVLGQQTENKTTENLQIAWLDALNSSKSLELFYTKNSGFFYDNTLIVGVLKIDKKLKLINKTIGRLASYNLIESFQLYENQKFDQGEYKTTNGKTYSTIIGWRRNGIWTKEFEVIYERTTNLVKGMKSVKSSRDNWEKYSNLHRPDKIVDEVFSTHGKYFNRGILYNGKEISKAYSYMNNESYKIKLEPLRVSQVSDNIIFDIGTFEVGGKGLYTLIWIKENEQWKLLLDFNF